jgi:Zn-dependent protease
MFNINPATLISRIIILLIAFSFHEFAHAYVANAFGDDTPRRDGRLTLNPIAHLDLLGSIMLLFAGFGWAKPVQVNPYALQRRSPSAMMWVSLAGPFSNLLLAIVAAIPLRFGLITYTGPGNGIIPTLFGFSIEFIYINLLLMVFNLLPIAPLDGEKIAEYLFPPSWARVLQTIRPYGPIILMAVIFILPMIGIDIFRLVITPVISIIINFLLGV